MQRVSAGALRGRKLMALPDGVPGLRPMASRIREAVFDRLGPDVRDARVLDVFAGSGALAIEALSRGASFATLFELDARVVRHLRAQLGALALTDRAEVQSGDAVALLGAGHRRGAPYDLVFVDPPFASPHIFTPVLDALCAPHSAARGGGWLAPGARIVCERERVRGSAADPTGNYVLPPALDLEATRIYGQAQVEFLVLR